MNNILLRKHLFQRIEVGISAFFERSLMEIGTSFSHNTATAAINTKTQINVSSIKTQFTLNTTSKSNDVLGYYHNLCKDFPDVSFRLTDREESLKHVNEVFLGYNNSMNQVGNNFGDFGKCSIEIDVAVIRKMMRDSSFESNTKNYLNTLIEQVYPQFQATAVRDGMSNMCMNIDLEGNEIQVGATYAHCHFSTEEEIRKMWADEMNQTQLNNYFNQKKSELLDTYLAMIESSETKMRALTKETSHPSECKDFQKGRAYIHWAQTDVELQVYKSKSEDGSFTYRVDTSKNGELVVSAEHQ